jgi:hypothetical protein
MICANNHVHEVPEEFAFGEVRCATCLAPMYIHEPGPEAIPFEKKAVPPVRAAVEPPAEASKASPKHPHRRLKLRWVGPGLLLLPIATLLFVVGMGCRLLALSLNLREGVYGMAFLWGLGLVGFNLAALGESIGMLLFFRIPTAVRGRGLFHGAAIATLVQLALTLIPWFVLWDSFALLLILMILGLMLWATHKALFFSYAYRLAEYVDAEGVGHDVQRLLRQAMILTGLTICFALLIFAASHSLALWGMALGFPLDMCSGWPCWPIGAFMPSDISP